MFSDRQLLVHGTFVDEYRRVMPEVEKALPADRAAAVLLLLGLMQGKALDYNSRQCTWDVTRDRVGHGFEEHAFPFRSTHPEFEGARELYPWALQQLLDAYKSLSGLLWPEVSDLFNESARSPGNVTVIEGNAADLKQVEAGSQAVVCIDPPYYDNVCTENYRTSSTSGRNEHSVCSARTSSRPISQTRPTRRSQVRSASLTSGDGRRKSPKRTTKRR